MSLSLFKSRLAQELPQIAKGMAAALATLPQPSKPCAEHVISAGGKRLRPFLVVMFSRMLGADSESVYELAACMELLHAATLLHDDVLDNADQRRGKPAGHTVFGVPSAILSGDALLALGNSIVASYGEPRLCSSYSEATMRTAAGEIAEMSASGRPDLALEAYLEIAAAKTGCLISESCALGAIFAGASDELVEQARIFGANLGLAFQIVDDTLDFAPSGQTGKPCGGDLREGKATPPVIFYRASLTGSRLETFDSSFGAFSADQIEDIARGIEPYVKASLELGDQYLAQAEKALTAFPECAERQVLSEMTAYIRSRAN